MVTNTFRNYAIATALALTAATAGAALALAQAGVGLGFYNNDYTPGLLNAPRGYYNYVPSYHASRVHHPHRVRPE